MFLMCTIYTPIGSESSNAEGALLVTELAYMRIYLCIVYFTIYLYIATIKKKGDSISLSSPTI